jgi:hypothetical protein
MIRAIDIGTFCLHENKFPFTAEHFLQLRQVFRLVVGQFKTRFILHGALTEINGIVGVFRLETVAWPKVGRLESIECIVVFDCQVMIVLRNVTKFNYSQSQTQHLRINSQLETNNHAMTTDVLYVELRLGLRRPCF